MQTRTPFSSITGDSHQFRGIIRRASSALRDSLGGGLLERLDSIVQILAAKMYDELLADRVGNRPRFFVETDDTVDSVYGRVASLYCELIEHPEYRVLFEQKRIFTSDRSAVHRITGLLQPLRLGDLLYDPHGSAFQEILRDTFDKTENQQYFTPMEVSEFMAAVGAKALGKPLWTARVCDPAVGTGGLCCWRR
ncbi:MAG: N-6 DNA methylase [Bacillota bacterium]|nr:N-6 DNA methylase [Bacillota bacterium]